MLTSSQLQRDAWVQGTGSIVCTFVDIVSGFLEDVEILLGYAESLQKPLREHIPHFKQLYDQVIVFYHHIIDHHPTMAVDEIIAQPQWKDIQKKAHEMHILMAPPCKER
ncbi:MAG: hypothetical protein KDK71_06245 [Chlamydiia bacterium]|nr:hypothetical protein [Chlamydiia bacterium]